jgi:hypothetical protein
MRFDLERVPGGGQSLYFPRLLLNDLNVYVNRHALWKLSETYAPGVPLAALRIPIPPGLLQVGENTIHLEATGYSHWYQGISRVYVGDTAALSRRAAMRSLSQGQMNRIVAAAFGAIGILCLWLWLRAGREPVLFWYGVSGVTLLVVTALGYISQWHPEFVGWRVGLVFMRYHGYLVPFFILHLRACRPQALLAGKRPLACVSRRVLQRRAAEPMGSDGVGRLGAGVRRAAGAADGPAAHVAEAAHPARDTSAGGRRFRRILSASA